MASTSSAAPYASYSILLPKRSQNITLRDVHESLKISRGRSRTRRLVAAAAAAAVQDDAEGSNKQQSRAPPGVDTRIHWDSPDEGWIGGGSSSSGSKQQPTPEELRAEAEKNLLGQDFSDLLNNSSDSHYQFLGVSAKADIEEIKSAYRRLSKEYHPDTTSLPIRAASDNFMKLRQIYEVLSNEETRRFYDWTLAQETASKQAEKMRMKFKDPYQQDLENFESVPDMVDRLGGKNLKLSDQAMSALTFDIAIIIFSICCIIYVIIFKVPSY